MLKDVKVIIYTSSYRIEGAIKIRLSSDRPYTRLADLLRAASARGDDEFLLLTHATVMHLATRELVEGHQRVLGVNKSTIQFIIPHGDTLSEKAYELDLGGAP